VSVFCILEVIYGVSEVIVGSVLIAWSWHSSGFLALSYDRKGLVGYS
jgi:hypothetical protein